VRPGHVRALVYLLTHRPVELSAEQKTELHTWIKENAVHLNTVEAGSGFEDMQPLKDVIGDARIVALGELPHLTREFYQVKHRMVEFLVTEMDFTLFAIEGTFAGALELNDYILTGDGDAERALAALVYPAWVTEEVLAMVKWMREYNATHEKKVKFYGIDDKPAMGSAEAVYKYLKKTNGTSDYDEVLEVLKNPWTSGQLLSGPKAKIHSTAEEIGKLIAYLETKRPAYTRQSPSEQEIEKQREWGLASQHARVLLQNLKFRGLPSISAASNLRDIHMAENVRWIMDYEKGAKMILWAANPHINGAPGDGMGSYLRRAYGDDIVIVGLLFNRRFSAEPNDELSTESTNQLTSESKGNLEATLAKAGLNIGVLDFRSPPKGIVSKYFKSPIRADNGANYVYPWAYDAVLFVESTTNARPASGGRIGKYVTLEKSANLGFEEMEDGRLRDWNLQGGQSRVEYETTGSDEQPYEGDMCGMIKRVPGRAFGQSMGNIVQSVKPGDFKGKKIQFSAAVRVTGGRGYLWLSIDNRSKEPDVFRQQEITSEKWQQYSISAEVSQKASKITYGLAYVGEGAVFIDAVSIGSSE
jgi:erythromycin esterase